MSRPLRSVLLAGLVLVVVAAPALAAEPIIGNLEVVLASPLGATDAAETAEAVEIAPDASVVVGGTMTADLGAAPTDLGGTTGTVTRLAADGTVRSVSRLGAAVDDLDVDQTTGAIAVATDTGVALLSADASAVRWSADLGAGGGASDGPGRRVATAGGGTVAALYGRVVTVFDQEGSRLSQITVGHQFVNDVTLDPASGLVIVTGFDNRKLPGGGPVQVAFLEAYAADGTPAWARYGWDGALLAGNEADTRGMRVDIGADGLLYLAAEAAGGNHIFRSLPDDLAASADLVTTDEYQNAFNTASNHITYVGVFAPAAGEYQRGTMLLARLPADKGRKGNTIRPAAVTADEAGNVYVGGVSAYGIPGLDGFTFSGVPRPGTYAGGSWVAVLDPTLTTRLLWTSHGPSGATRGLAAGHGLAALAARVQGQEMVVVDPLPGQAAFAANASADAPDGYLSVWAGFTPGGAPAPAPPAPAPAPPAPAPAPPPPAPAPPAAPAPVPPVPAPAPEGSFLQGFVDAIARLVQALGELFGNLLSFGSG